MERRNVMQNRRHIAYIVAAFVACLLLAHASMLSGSNDRSELSADDEKAIRTTIEAYRTMWLANDVKGVLNTFTDDAVLLPAHGAPAVVGMSAIEKYWF